MNLFKLIQAERKYFVVASIFVLVVFVVVLIQNVIRYGIHESYNPWRSVLHLIFSWVLILPFLPVFLGLSMRLRDEQNKKFWIRSSLLIILGIVLFYSISSVFIHLVGFYDQFYSAQFASQYFGREAFFHILLLTGTIVYVSQRKSPEQKFISGSVGRKEMTVLAELVKWIEADDHYLKIHVAETAMMKRSTLEKMAEELKPDFIRIHRKYLVNKNEIVGKEKKQRDEYVILKSGERLKVGRSYSPIQF